MASLIALHCIEGWRPAWQIPGFLGYSTLLDVTHVYMLPRSDRDRAGNSSSRLWLSWVLARAWRWSMDERYNACVPFTGHMVMRTARSRSGAGASLQEDWHLCCGHQHQHTHGR